MSTASLFLYPIFCQIKSRLATSLPLIPTPILRIKMTVSSQQAASWWMAAPEGCENMHVQAPLSFLNSSDKVWTCRSYGSICVNSITEPTILKSFWINLRQWINQTWSQKVLNKSFQPLLPLEYFWDTWDQERLLPFETIDFKTLKSCDHKWKGNGTLYNQQRRWWWFSAVSHSIYPTFSSSRSLCFM